jgi:hypothetical protein
VLDSAKKVIVTVLLSSSLTTLTYAQCLELIGASIDPGLYGAVTVSHNYAFVADSEAGLRVFDISRPELPHQLTTEHTPGSAIDVEIADGRLVLAENDFALHIFDVSNPRSPNRIGAVKMPYPVQSVVVDSALAYIAGFSGGLRIVDLTNPTSPFELASLNVPGMAYGVSVGDDEFAFVGTLTGGLRVINVKNPGRPVEQASLEVDGRATEVVQAKDHLFVGGTPSRVSIVDITNPKKPRQIGSFKVSDTARLAQRFAVNRDRLFVADDHLWMVDISDPAQPELVAADELPVEDEASGIAVTDNGLVLVTAGSGGMLVYDTTSCQRTPRRASLEQSQGGAS